MSPYNPSIIPDLERKIGKEAATLLEDQRLAAEKATQAARDDLSFVDTLKLGNTPVPTGAVRLLDQNFVVSLSSPALVFYTVEMTVVLNDVTVALVVDGSDFGDAYLSSSLLGLTLTQRQQLVGYVMPGDNVLLSKSGSGSASIVQSLELVFS